MSTPADIDFWIREAELTTAHGEPEPPSADHTRPARWRPVRNLVTSAPSLRAPPRRSAGHHPG